MKKEISNFSINARLFIALRKGEMAITNGVCSGAWWHLSGIGKMKHGGSAALVETVSGRKLVVVGQRRRSTNSLFFLEHVRYWSKEFGNGVEETRVECISRVSINSLSVSYHWRGVGLFCKQTRKSFVAQTRVGGENSMTGNGGSSVLCAAGEGESVVGVRSSGASFCFLLFQRWSSVFGVGKAGIHGVGRGDTLRVAS